LAQEYPFIGRIQVSNSLNVRSAPKLGAPVIGRLKANSKVVVLSEEGEFYKLQYPKQLESWMASWLLLGKGQEKSDVVARDQVNVRSGPGMQYPVIAQIKRESQVTILEMNKNKWVRIGAPNEATAWVSKKFVAAEESLAAHNQRQEKAQKGQQMYNQAVTTFKHHLNNKKISEEAYQQLKAQFQEAIALLPNSNEATKAKDFQIKLAEFRGVTRLHELKMEEERKLKEREASLTAEHQAQLEQVKNETKEEIRKFEFEGWLDDIGGILFRPASHSLKKGDDILFYLKSEDVRLDDYVGKHVGINGEVQRFRGWGRIIIVKEISILHENPSQFWTSD
jgi:uncharacterized protein YgiM (DUF1202 family)